jgi:hypothetical protein
VGVFNDVYTRRIAAYNGRKGRHSQGCSAIRTSSFNNAFVAMSAGWVLRMLSDAQFRLVTMECTLKAVLPDGRVCGKDGWLYGEDLDDGLQDQLLRLQGRKVRSEPIHLIVASPPWCGIPRVIGSSWTALMRVCAGSSMTRKGRGGSDPTPAQMAEFRRNFDNHLRRNAGAGEELA